MNDDTILKMMAMGCLTGLAIAYFILVKSDGAIFGTVATALGTMVGYEVGKRRNST